MIIREIINSDLKVTKSIVDRRGRQRIFVSLRGISFVNKTYWMREEELANPETLKMIKGDMQDLASKKLSALLKFTEEKS